MAKHRERRPNKLAGLGRKSQQTEREKKSAAQGKAILSAYTQPIRRLPHVPPGWGAGGTLPWHTGVRESPPAVPVDEGWYKPPRREPEPDGQCVLSTPSHQRCGRDPSEVGPDGRSGDGRFRCWLHASYTVPWKVSQRVRGWRVR